MIGTLSNQELLQRTTNLAVTDRRLNVEILLYLAEIDRRRLYADQGHSSMWEFCRKALLFSESVAGKRIAAARALAKFPDTVAMLQDGRLSVCILAVLAPHLTADNAAQLLQKAAGLSKREVEDLVVALGATAGKTATRDMIRRVAPPIP